MRGPVRAPGGLDLTRSAEAALVLHVRIRVGQDEPDRLMEEARQAHKAELASRARARETAKRAVIGLRRAGVSVRDVERLVGVSVGQVSKLANA